MAIVGLGIDLTDVHRIRRILQGSRGRRFEKRVFSCRERAYCGMRLDPAECYGARFAAKEAFAKALGAPPGLGWHEVEVVREKGGPTLCVTGKAATILVERGVKRTHLSLSHDGDMAAAVVVLED